MSLDLALLIGAAVALVAVFAARLGSRLGLPALLLFLAVGMALGESGLGIRFDDAQLAHDLGFAALVVILAEGGLTTRWNEVRPSLAAAISLATVGVLASIGLVTLFAHFILRLPLPVAALLGAVTAPTDSAAVFSVLRGVPLPARLRAMLEGESGLNDAPTVLLVVLFTEIAIGHPVSSIPAVAGLVIGELVGGIAVGMVVGVVAVFLMRRIALPASGLYPLATLAWAVGAYGLGVLAHVSGFAAVYVCSVVLGNGRLPHRHAVRSFAEGIGWVSQIGLFVMLGLLASPGRITLRIVVVGIIGGLFLTLIARPVSVMISTASLRVPWRHQVFLSWAGLRGAVPIILATVQMAQRMPHADQLFDVVLVFVVVFTALQAPTLPWFGRRLGLVAEQTSEVEIEAAPSTRSTPTCSRCECPRAHIWQGSASASCGCPPMPWSHWSSGVPSSSLPAAATCCVRATSCSW